jgi:hypothetical protein
MVYLSVLEHFVNSSIIYVIKTEDLDQEMKQIWVRNRAGERELTREYI